MTVQQKLETIALGMELGYIYADLKQTDLFIPEEQLPACVHVPPTAGSFSNASAQYKDSPATILFFADSVNPELSTIENEETIERMKLCAMRFIEEMNNSCLFKAHYGKITYQVHYNLFANPVSGVAITITPEELEGTRMA